MSAVFSNPKNKPSTQVMLHVLIWVLLLAMPFFLWSNEPFDIVRQLRFTVVPMLFYAIIFYLNYFYLIDALLFRKKAVLFIGINLVVIISLTALHFQIREMLNTILEARGLMTPPKNRPPVRFLIYKDLISMLIPMIICLAVKTTEKWAKVESDRKEREKEMLHSELQHLKYQLQPHFFFNSLNTVYALIERSPVQAQETVHHLSKLMRYLLYDTDSGKASLADELDFMSQYINLMKLRISDKTTVCTDFPTITDEHNIAPLLFISLIENGFKHGISATQHSEIYFGLSVEGKRITFKARNNNFPKNEKDKSGSGIGLANLRKRLELSYPGRYNFMTGIEGPAFVALLEIETD